MHERLSAQKWVRPGITQLERMVSTARQQAQAETFRLLGQLLSPQQLAALDTLLFPDEQTNRIPLTWLQRGATANSPRAILTTLEKLTFVRQWGVAEQKLTLLNPNRVKLLAQIGRRMTPARLQRVPVERRYPILVCFIWRSHEDLIDEVVDLYDRCLADAYARDRRDLDEFCKTVARSTNEKLRLFQQITRVLLITDIADEDIRTDIYATIPPERLRSALSDCARIIRPADDSYFDFLANPYSYIRQFAPALLGALAFRSNRQDNSLLDAVNLLQHLNRAHQRKVPNDAPIAFVPARWRPYIIAREGHINRRYYELCVLWELRGAIRSGDIWIEGSRRYGNPETYLIGPDRWAEPRPELCQLVQTPADGSQRLQERQAELEAQLSHLDEETTTNEQIHLNNGRIVLSPLTAATVPSSSQKLKQLMTERLPHVELSESLIEVDSWANFSHYFQHAAGGAARTEELRQYIYATILAQACNLGLSTMAELAGLPKRRLFWYANWYVHEETLRAMTREIVNFQYHQPLSQH